MSHDSIRARLNLYAVLPNLEDVVRDDPEMRALVGETRIIVRFLVAGGPTAWVRIADGACTVGRGAGPGADRLEAAADPPHPGAAVGPGGIPSVVLSFASASHLNKMFDGTGSPMPSLRTMCHVETCGPPGRSERAEVKSLAFAFSSGWANVNRGTWRMLAGSYPDEVAEGSRRPS